VSIFYLCLFDIFVLFNVQQTEEVTDALEMYREKIGKWTAVLLELTVMPLLMKRFFING